MNLMSDLVVCCMSLVKSTDGNRFIYPDFFIAWFLYLIPTKVKHGGRRRRCFPFEVLWHCWDKYVVERTFREGLLPN